MTLLKIIGIIYLCTLVPSFLVARLFENRGHIKRNPLEAVLKFLNIWLVSPIAIPHCLIKALRK